MWLCILDDEFAVRPCLISSAICTSVAVALASWYKGSSIPFHPGWQRGHLARKTLVPLIPIGSVPEWLKEENLAEPANPR